jgi:hypothetical protein
MVELLLAVVAIQCISPTKPVRASAIWLAGNGTGSVQPPSEVNDCAVDT